ncbi:MAG: ribosomal protein S18-alanine N-acetyltransferase [Acidobacteriaceae bacterium]
MIMEQAVTIRRARQDDLHCVLAVEQGSDTAPHWSRQIYEEMLEEPVAGRPRRCFLVAESWQERASGGYGPEVIGFVVAMVCGGAVSEIVGCVGELESVVVSAVFRRGGVGQTLCLSAVEWCREQGAVEVQLEVRAGSHGALSLYRRLGFIEAGRRRGYYREPDDDALLMRLSFRDDCDDF